MCKNMIILLCNILVIASLFFYSTWAKEEQYVPHDVPFECLPFWNFEDFYKAQYRALERVSLRLGRSIEPWYIASMKGKRSFRYPVPKLMYSNSINPSSTAADDVFYLMFLSDALYIKSASNDNVCRVGDTILRVPYDQIQKYEAQIYYATRWKFVIIYMNEKNLTLDKVWDALAFVLSYVEISSSTSDPHELKY